MGLSSSKHNASNQSQRSSSGSFERTRSRILKPPCLGSHGFDDNGESHEFDSPSEETGDSTSCPRDNKPISDNCYERDSKTEQCNGELNESSSSSSNRFKEGNTSRTFYSTSLNASGRFLSRLSLRPKNLSFNLTRSHSLNSARSRQVSFSLTNDGEDCIGSSSNQTSRDQTRRGCDFFPACFSHRSPRLENESCVSNAGPDAYNNFQDDHQIHSNRDVFSYVNSDDDRLRHDDTRVSGLAPVERRFSRTLSVGRLRDRVIRRTPLDLHHFGPDRELRRAREFRMNSLDHEEFEEAPHDDNSNLSRHASTDRIGTLHSHGSHSHVHETPRARETRYRDLMENRSSFIERRRRIRSQVRALQRLGSRFENLPPHERSCILSGQHRAGRCICNNVASNSTDDANARASISRIVMLAETLFEVLDEIHQQSVVLSSRPSVSSIGSVPAPNEIVDSLPLNIFRKSKKKTCEDSAQCYICLVEYEDGDSMRMLPCHHEFHTACIDKWLKEIHRVCPLCRGDICQATQLQ